MRRSVIWEINKKPSPRTQKWLNFWGPSSFSLPQNLPEKLGSFAPQPFPMGFVAGRGLLDPSNRQFRGPGREVFFKLISQIRGPRLFKAVRCFSQMWLARPVTWSLSVIAECQCWRTNAAVATGRRCRAQGHVKEGRRGSKTRDTGGRQGAACEC